uniref:DUF1248 domain-containing protein n=1 Tax=Steinernema glaseri TaxID=37863 RepID=A0A1I7XWK2_9BILA
MPTGRGSKVDNPPTPDLFEGTQRAAVLSRQPSFNCLARAVHKTTDDERNCCMRYTDGSKLRHLDIHPHVFGATTNKIKAIRNVWKSR